MSVSELSSASSDSGELVVNEETAAKGQSVAPSSVSSESSGFSVSTEDVAAVEETLADVTLKDFNTEEFLPVTPRIDPVVIDCNQSDVGTHCRTISQTISDADLDNMEDLKITQKKYNKRPMFPKAAANAHIDSVSYLVRNVPSKHYLQSSWILYYCKAQRTRRWEDCMQKVTTIDCVEDYWSTYNHMHLPSGLEMKTDYYMFKFGVEPMWEDPANVQGGRWLIHVDKSRRYELIDFYWIELTLALIGELFDDIGDSITGAVVNIRQKGDKISCWIKSNTSDDAIRKIGLAIKKKLNIPETEKISYETHAALAHKNSSQIKPIMQL